MHTRAFWRELGVMFFSARLNAGQEINFGSPVPEFTLETPTVPVVVKGRFIGYSDFRDPIEWPALPGKTEGGMAFPGRHRLVALEDDSVYSCVCFLPPNLTEVTPDMFALDHRYVAADTTAEFSQSEGYKAVIVMSGAVTVDGLTYGAGGKIVVPDVSPLVLQVEAAAHLVGYRLTEERAA